ncbi:MAG: NfeD family protein [Candidatus Abyssubacteria bacterium]
MSIFPSFIRRAKSRYNPLESQNPFSKLSSAIMLVILASATLILTSTNLSLLHAAPTRSKKVAIIPVHGVIDLGLTYFISRSIESAERDGADAIILELDTLGGRVDAALDIRDALEQSRLPVTAYVSRRAISAGALICLATKEIAMAPGSTIGAATPVRGEGAPVSEKEISYVRGEFRATAEHNGHSPLLAEAMVDPDIELMGISTNGGIRIVTPEEAEKLEKEGIEVEVVSPKGKLLTLTAREAERLGLASVAPESLDEFVSSLGYDQENIVRADITWSERLVRFLTHPLVSALLLTLGVLGIFFELQMPGWGVSGTLGAALLLLFFCGHYLAGLAGIFDIVLFLIGLTLIAAELFIVPGFGITGISGIVCVLISLYLALVKRPIPQTWWDYQRLNIALPTLVFSLLAVLIGSVIIWRLFPNSPMKKLLVLSANESVRDGYVASGSLDALVGQVGRSLTSLRPTGKALIRDEPIEVQSEGDFIEKDRPVRVVRVTGNKVFVAEEDKGA